MPIGTKADFKIYDEQYFAGQFERVMQTLELFNGASSGAIVLESKLTRGEYERKSFMKFISGLIVRRDPTDVSAATDVKPTQGEFVGVKLNRGIGPAAQTLDAWKKIAEDPQLFSFYLGRMVAEQKLQEMVNTAVRIAEAALQGQANLVHSVDRTMDHTALVDAMAKRGDRAQDIVAWVMHSKPYFDLVKQSIADKIFGVANVTVYQGTAATLGKPTIVIDSAPLKDTGSPNTYNTLGLVPGAVTVKESETETVVLDGPITGLKNLIYRLQGEYAYNVEVQGFKYDTAQGVNPDDTVLGTAATWVKEATDDKALAGVRLVTQ
jgi:hypothetical protein